MGCFSSLGPNVTSSMLGFSLDSVMHMASDLFVSVNVSSSGNFEDNSSIFV